ncbi:MAG: hypothetical protein FJX25_15040 [Alphaproteobacteria bacterium]|nr:hypothetical protein [Alphaproteobacteria bacterium]
MSPLSPRAPDGRGLAPLAARASRRSGAPSGRAELGYRGGQSRAILNREATPEHGESAEVFRSRIKPACTAISAPTLGTAPPLPIAHSATAREIVALRPVPFIRPPNYALTRYHRGSDGSWRADPPELPALPSL